MGRRGKGEKKTRKIPYYDYFTLVPYLLVLPKLGTEALYLAGYSVLYTCSDCT